MPLRSARGAQRMRGYGLTGGVLTCAAEPKEPVMTALASFLLVQVALLTGQVTPSTLRGMPPDFPTKIWVQEGLRDIVTRMWTTSPTFRQQCLRIQDGGPIQVQLRLDPTLAGNSTHRAICELRSYTGGALIARLAVAPVNIPELIGHEMEHVCERLDGIHVEQQSRDHKPGFYLIDRLSPFYETERAIRVGRQVMAEMNVATSLTRRQQDAGDANLSRGRPTTR
jgi:hypothetical protein